MSGPLRIAALISGGGRTMLNLADRIDAGALDATIALVIGSRPGIAGIERARERGFEVRGLDPDVHADDDARHDAIDGWLDDHRIDLVCLCGYTRWLRVAPARRGTVMNIHPALLPEFGGRGMYGSRVHQAVLDAGRTESGCTVHFVDEEYDHGPTILQRTCPVLPGDDADALAARVFAEECIAYPEAVGLFAAGRLRTVDGRVDVSAEPSSESRVRP